MSERPAKHSPSTDEVLTLQTDASAPAADRVADWQSVLSELVHPVGAEVPGSSGTDGKPDNFSGRLRMGRFGVSAWLEIDASAQILHRGTAEIEASEGRWLFVSTMTHGYGWLNAAGERKRVDCGQTVFVDSAQTYSLEFDKDFAFVSAMLPRADLLAYQPHAPGAHASRVPEPVGSALHSFLNALATTDAPPGARPGRRLYDHFVGLVLSAIEPIALSAPGTRPSTNEVLLSRIQGTLLASLSHSEIGSAWVAERLGLSLRQVQRLFKTSGTTVARWVLEQRLQRCAEELADPALAERAIGDIAQSWGFNDLSYFSRSFYRRYGCRPTQFRATLPHDPDAD